MRPGKNFPGPHQARIEFDRLRQQPPRLDHPRGVVTDVGRLGEKEVIVGGEAVGLLAADGIDARLRNRPAVFSITHSSGLRDRGGGIVDRGEPGRPCAGWRSELPEVPMAEDAPAWIERELAGCRFADERLGRRLRAARPDGGRHGG